MQDYPSTIDLVLGVSALVILSHFFVSWRSNKPAPLPPGPIKLPFVGNILDLHKGKDWDHWSKHKVLYGKYEFLLSFKLLY